MWTGLDAYLCVLFCPSYFFQRKGNIISLTIGTISLETLTFEIEYIKVDNSKDLIISTFP